jgi:vacuolar-type H+-ATPase subunit I/STV1
LPLPLYTTLFGVAILSLAVLAAIAGLMVAQRWVSLELRQSHNLTIGIVYGALHVSFGVIIGFSAYLALNKYTLAQEAVVNEAGDV